MPASPTAPLTSRFATLRRLAPSVAAAIAGLIVFHGALACFFAQDDFLGLARASGLAPRLEQPWRYIANQAVWDAMRPFGATRAWPYHLLSLIVHAACVALLGDLLARRLAPWAALIGATFFAAHPSLFGDLYWFSAVGDPLALCFGLLALEVQQRADRWRWLALPLFTLSLLSKESLVLLPLVVVAYRAWGAPRIGPRPIDGLSLALAAVAAAYVVYFATVAYGTYFVRGATWTASGAHAPYALALGGHLWRNLLTYLGWSVAFLLPVVRHYSNVTDPGVYPWGVAAILSWLAGLASPPLRARGWLVGGAAWSLFILPALPLRNHTYHYYLYAPLAGAAWCVAAAADRLLAPRGAAATGPAATRRAWGVAGLVALALTVNGALLARKIETMPFVLPELRAAEIVDRARIAANVYRSLAAAHLPPGVTLLFWSPIASSLGPRGGPLAGPAPEETYWERNVRDALVDGLAVRVLFPQVAAVRFVRAFAPAPPDHRYAVYRPEGRLGIATPAELDSIIRASSGRR